MSIFRSSLGSPFPNSVAQKTIAGFAMIAVLAIFLVVAQIDEHAQVALGGGVAALSILSFVIFFQSDRDREDRNEALRRAIAASTVLTFLVVFSLVIFSEDVQIAAGGTAVAAQLISDFRWVVISVVGFYFANDSVGAFLARRYGRRDSAAPVAPTIPNVTRREQS